MGLGTSNNQQNFAPVQTKTISVTATTGLVTFDFTSPSVVKQLDSNQLITSILVQNAGSKIAFINFGSSSVAATTADTPILPGAIYVMDKGVAMSVAAICGGADTTTLYVTAGIGA